MFVWKCEGEDFLCSLFECDPSTRRNRKRPLADVSRPECCKRDKECKTARPEDIKSFIGASVKHVPYESRYLCTKMDISPAWDTRF